MPIKLKKQMRYSEDELPDSTPDAGGVGLAVVEPREAAQRQLEGELLHARGVLELHPKG